MNRQRLEFATAGFLLEMRKQFAKAQPAAPNPIKALSDYPPPQRSALMSAVEQAIKLSEPATDQTFETWRLKREQEAEANQAAAQ